MLSTGIALPDSAAELTAYADSLAKVGVAEPARRAGPPVRRGAEAALVAAAEARSVPLIELRREVAFIEITEKVPRIIDELLVSRAAATLALGGSHVAGRASRTSRRTGR